MKCEECPINAKCMTCPENIKWVKEQREKNKMVLKPGDHVTVAGTVIKVENGCALVKSNDSDTEFWMTDKDI